MPNEPRAVHNAAAQRFEIEIDGALAYAHYAPRGGATLEFDHTYVPAALRGRGLAGTLVTAGLDYARAQRLTVLPSCSYVAAFIRAHPQYADLLARRDA